ncbi:helix-turn-helix transcriptional regulator [Nocardiopsis sp. FIRDI 009]|uniref:helix-turn-helix domain-containing protein n=1 Tax=Nocardiopsis sp. FIRDI 009 TaxID=714197 RepID=UPI001E4FC6CA|nr:helix-turn-helix transcriptional regulator [Nocardiopsis sp. FIRDI 009]
MPQPLKTLRPGRSARDWFGAELRHWRLKRGLTQAELGRQAWTSGSLIGKIETAERDCPEELARKLDEVLDTGGVLGRAQELVRSRRPAMLIPAPRHESALAETGTTQSLWTWNGEASPGESASLEALPGSFFGGATVEVGVHHASRGSGHVLVETPEDQSGAEHRPRLLIGLSDGDDRRMIALNERRARRARREGRHSGDRVRLRIPDAYVLDDLTLGVLWAVSSLDSALGA